MQDSGGAFGQVIRAGHSSRAFGNDSRTSIQSWHELRNIHRSFIRQFGHEIMLSIHRTVSSCRRSCTHPAIATSQNYKHSCRILAPSIGPYVHGQEVCSEDLRRAGLGHFLRTIRRSETGHTTHDQGKPQIQCACTEVKSYLEGRRRVNALGKRAHGADI